MSAIAVVSAIVVAVVVTSAAMIAIVVTTAAWQGAGVIPMVISVIEITSAGGIIGDSAVSVIRVSDNGDIWAAAGDDNAIADATAEHQTGGDDCDECEDFFHIFCFLVS